MKTFLEVKDLIEIRSLAQRLLKEKVYKYPRYAVRAARKALFRMKRFFIDKTASGGIDKIGLKTTP